MAVSPFVVACALHDDEIGESGTTAAVPTLEGHPLVLTAEQQREMHEALERMDTCVRALTERMPEVEMSVLEGLNFVQRCHKQLDDERARLRAMDGGYLA